MLLVRRDLISAMKENLVKLAKGIFNYCQINQFMLVNNLYNICDFYLQTGSLPDMLG